MGHNKSNILDGKRVLNKGDLKNPDDLSSNWWIYNWSISGWFKNWTVKEVEVRLKRLEYSLLYEV